jgi:hypothetical protein
VDVAEVRGAGQRDRVHHHVGPRHPVQPLAEGARALDRVAGQDDDLVRPAGQDGGGGGAVGRIAVGGAQVAVAEPGEEELCHGM